MLLPKRSSRRIFAVPASLAAGIALAFGLVLGIAFGPRVLAPDAARWAADAGVVAPGTALFDALQTLPSGESRNLGAGFAATARLTFAAAEGRYCRHIDLIGPRGTTAALACGGGDGWRVETATFAPAAGGPAGAYRPASGPDAALEAAIDERIDGAPLDAARRARAHRAPLGKRGTVIRLAADATARETAALVGAQRLRRNAPRGPQRLPSNRCVRDGEGDRRCGDEHSRADRCPIGEVL